MRAEVHGPAFLVHPALPNGIVAVGPAVAPPLSEATLPGDWRSLPEEVQELELARTWARALMWARRRGVSRARARPQLGDKSTGAWLAAVAVADGEEFLLSGPALFEILGDAFPRPVEFEVFAGERLVLQVYGSWDGIVAYPESGEAVRELEEPYVTGA